MSRTSIETVPDPIGKDQSEQLISAWRPKIKHLHSTCSGEITEQSGTVGTVRAANLQNSTLEHDQAVGMRVAGPRYWCHSKPEGTHAGGVA